MSDLAIPRRKRHAMGHKENKYAEGGMVVPRVGGATRKPAVPEYADAVVANSKRPVHTTRAGNKANPLPITKEPNEGRTKEAGANRGSAGNH